MNKQRFDKLEAIRGFAALYVVFFHVLPQKFYLWGINVGILFRFGPEAVIIFFVLSGFVIKYSFEKSRDKSFKNYLFRRFIRLYIPLIMIYIFAYALKSFQAGELIDPEFRQLAGNLLMLQDVITQKPNVLCGVYLGNGPLWSLSYEWWFYMLFFFLVKYIKSEKLNLWVSIFSIVAAASYLIYPFFINRLVMYFAIWWIGVLFASAILNNEEISLKKYLPFLGVMFTIMVILGVNLYVNRAVINTYQYKYSAFPIIEIRHVTFAFMVMIGAILWHRLKWFSFDWFFGIFKYLAPASYVIYISHTYLVVEADYLKFINNRFIEYTLYFVVLILFSFFVEVFIYNKIKNVLVPRKIKR
jgi:peptidoglycan/LPS O-acetylase OafA/YrhL